MRQLALPGAKNLKKIKNIPKKSTPVSCVQPPAQPPAGLCWGSAAVPGWTLQELVRSYKTGAILQSDRVPEWKWWPGNDSLRMHKREADRGNLSVWGPVKEELRPILFKISKFMTEITKIQIWLKSEVPKWVCRWTLPNFKAVNPFLRYLASPGHK